MTENCDVAIIGAGASGLMCATEAGKRKKKVIVLDNGPKPGRKILMAGGGKCNFTNRRVSPENYICGNPHFVKSALSRFTSEDFIAMVDAAGIPYHERSHGQLFCNDSSARILEMLTERCRKAGVDIIPRTSVTEIQRDEGSGRFRLLARNRDIHCSALVIATGGASIPAAGATAFGYQVAAQFNIPMVPPRPGLVPFTLAPEDKALFQPLSGLSVAARVSCGNAEFEEQLLFTHRGLSGPVILQISSYWQPGDTLTIDLLPGLDLGQFFDQARKKHPKKQARALVCKLLPRRLVETRLSGIQGIQSPLVSLSLKKIQEISDRFHRWQIKPGGTEGNRTAEVTVGGVDCHAVSSKTFEAVHVPGLYFIGEVLDVTGQLGGYNLQWAWSSGFCAGQWV